MSFKGCYLRFALLLSLLSTSYPYRWLQTSVRPVVTNEYQLLYVCHLVGPLLQRLTHEKPKVCGWVKTSWYVIRSEDSTHVFDWSIKSHLKEIVAGIAGMLNTGI